MKMKKRYRNKKKRKWRGLLAFILIIAAGLGYLELNDNPIPSNSQTFTTNIPQNPLAFRGEFYLHLDELDHLGRAINAHIQLNTSEMPTEQREPRINFDPVGWRNFRFYYLREDGEKRQAWLMNRGHLVGYQFSGLNDEPRNLTPITRYLNAGTMSDRGLDRGNVNGMLYYEMNLRNWLDNHPNYRLDYQVTAIYEGDELWPRQVRLAYVGFDARGNTLQIRFNSPLEHEGNGGATVVYLENVSPNVRIDYLNGVAESVLE